MKSGKFNKKFWKRAVFCALGVIVSAFSVGLFKLAEFGVDPFQSLMVGLDMWIPMDFGTLYVVVNAVLLIFSLVTDRHYVGLGTFVNLFLTGYIADFSHKTLMGIFPGIGLGGRIVSLLIGIVIMCFAAAIYFAADMGVSTYDAVALIFDNKFHLGRFKIIRIVTDTICVALGVVLFFLCGGKLSGIGAVAGVGTIVTAFFMGPLIDFFRRTVADPLMGYQPRE